MQNAQAALGVDAKRTDADAPTLKETRNRQKLEICADIGEPECGLQLWIDQRSLTKCRSEHIPAAELSVGAP
jgi:hypothetical protein